jgi:hypothetical protein
MSKASEFRASRRREVNLRGGVLVTLRKPDYKRLFATIPLEPALFARLWARGNPDAKLTDEERALIAAAHDADLRDLALATICECAIEERVKQADGTFITTPRFYLTYEQAEAEGGLCVHDIDPDDHDKLSTAIMELEGVSKAQLEAVAPFPESPNAGTPGQEVQLPAVKPVRRPRKPRT